MRIFAMVPGHGGFVAEKLLRFKLERKLMELVSVKQIGNVIVRDGR